MKDIKGFDGKYAITEDGRVWSYRYNKFFTPQIDGSGYYRVQLTKDGKHRNYRIHRLVAEAFIPNPQNLPEVNHLDEVKTNNNVYNLEWCDHSYNINYGTRLDRMSKTLSHKVRCLETGEIFDSIRDCGSKLNIDTGDLSKHLRGLKCKKIKGLHFERID